MSKIYFYSVLAGATTDISQIEQFSCVRSVDDQTLKIGEDFLTFVPVYHVIGAVLAKALLETSTLEIDLNKMGRQDTIVQP